MNDTKDTGFTPPPRPAWVEAFNREGAVFDLKSVIPLDLESIVATARRNAGLEDFGTEEWREGLEVLLKALEEEASLNALGRMLARSDLITILEARLRVEDLYRRHPEIEDVKIEKPFWIFGQGRTGTSILQTLLGLDPANRVPSMYESLFPVPVNAPGEPDRRRDMANARYEQWDRIVPELAAMHEFSADTQAETIQFEALSMLSPAWLNLIGSTPSFSLYTFGKDYRIALRYALRVFKALEWMEPSRRWVMKSPISLSALPQVLDVFPDVCFVWPHRDPVKSLASVTNFIGTLDWMRSDVPRSPGTFAQLTDPNGIAASLNAPIDWLDDGTISPDRLCNIMYQDLLDDPVGVIRKIYAHFGLPFGAELERRLQTYAKENPREARPAHRYKVDSSDERRALFARYEARFNVPREA